MILGYNTNGFAHHRVEDTIAILSEIGYESVAVTLEHEHLDPPDQRGVEPCVKRLRPLFGRYGLRLTIETGSRFLLDPRRKHQPTLVSAAEDDRRRRIEFLKAAIDVAAAISADSVSLWSGAADDTSGEAVCFERLVASLEPLLRHASERGVRLAFEPEPGMFIDRMARFERLIRRLDHPNLGLTLDVGHAWCMDDAPFADQVAQWADRLWNVHVEDMRPGLHEHLMFGDGEIDFRRVFAALQDAAYAGPVHVELSRHSHDAVETARRSFRLLHSFVRGG